VVVVGVIVAGRYCIVGRSVTLRPGGFLLECIRQINPDLPVKILPTEQAAIAYAIGQCQENELIFASVNDIAGSIKLLTEIVTKEFPKMY
jgi:hypothetical protein